MLPDAAAGVSTRFGCVHPASWFPARSQCVVQVLVYDGLTRQLKRQFTRFKDKAYSGTFRSDGKLLVAGGENGLVQVL